MYRTMSRLLFPLAVAVSGVAFMTVVGQAPTTCGAELAQKCPRVAPVVLPDNRPAENLAVGVRVARPLRVSLPDFLNLGAAPRRAAEVIK